MKAHQGALRRFVIEVRMSVGIEALFTNALSLVSPWGVAT